MPQMLVQSPESVPMMFSDAISFALRWLSDSLREHNPKANIWKKKQGGTKNRQKVHVGSLKILLNSDETVCGCKYTTFQAILVKRTKK